MTKDSHARRRKTLLLLFLFPALYYPQFAVPRVVPGTENRRARKAAFRSQARAYANKNDRCALQRFLRGLQGCLHRRRPVPGAGWAPPFAPLTLHIAELPTSASTQLLHRLGRWTRNRRQNCCCLAATTVCCFLTEDEGSSQKSLRERSTRW